MKSARFALINNKFDDQYTFDLQGYVVILPFFMLLTTLLFIWRHRVLRQRFELGILNICNRVNATENIRGINYRFSKNGSDLNDITKQINVANNTNMKTIYSIVLEFDDRYNALTSKQFNRYSSVDFVTVPLYAHVNSSKDEKRSMYPAWPYTSHQQKQQQQQQQYDEKFIIQYE
ncbi:hypothetical protein [Parasitella parasitica]|uniref:Uncharacterized protein n=1 Tax=Parasitella parasitica TaxID=35722 RepID=A0A0B7N127_9FUNG|nr:hypothetical protein [Parasitella parasitica]